jgi:hypothetical protein
MNALNAHLLPPNRWPSAVDALDSVPAELSALDTHVSRCRSSRGRWFAVSCIGESIHAFVATRFVTTLVVAGAAMGIAMLYA